MRWKDIDFLQQIITVPKSKSGDVRYVQINSRATMILSALKSASGFERVFTICSPRSWFDPAVKAVGVKNFTWHCLRHTFVSRLVMAGVHLRTVQELAGHGHISMTCRYVHLGAATKTATDQSVGADRGAQIVQ
jgi:integrase